MGGDKWLNSLDIPLMPMTALAAKHVRLLVKMKTKNPPPISDGERLIKLHLIYFYLFLAITVTRPNALEYVRSGHLQKDRMALLKSMKAAGMAVNYVFPHAHTMLHSLIQKPKKLVNARCVTRVRMLDFHLPVSKPAQQVRFRLSTLTDFQTQKPL